MESEGMTGCCGAGIVFALDAEYYRMRNSRPDEIPDIPPQQILDNLKIQIVNGKSSMWGLLTATTSPNQAPVEQLLKLCGFEVLKAFQTPKHTGRELKLWGLDLNNVTLEQLNTIQLPGI